MSEAQQPKLDRDGWVDNLVTHDPIPLDGKDVYPPELLAVAVKNGWVNNTAGTKKDGWVNDLAAPTIDEWWD